MVSYMQVVTAEQMRKIRDANPDLGLFHCKKMAQKKNALDAIERARLEGYGPRVEHTILDVLQYLVER